MKGDKLKLTNKKSVKEHNVYASLVSRSQGGKPAPDGFTIAEGCCINCIHCYDESSITVCMKYNGFAVEWFNVCNDFQGVEGIN